MKKALILTIFAVLACFSNPAQAQKSDCRITAASVERVLQPVEQTEYKAIVGPHKLERFHQLKSEVQELNQYFETPLADSILARWSYYEDMIRRGLQVKESITVDIIQMSHGGSADFNVETNRLEPWLATSQLLTELILRNNRSRTVGIEGFSADSVTFSKYVSRERKRIKKILPDVTIDSASAVLTLKRKFGAVEYYATRRKNVQLVGLEDSLVDEFQTITLDYYHKIPKKKRSRLLETIPNLRSEIAMARMLIIADRVNDSQPAIVIGGFHGGYLFSIARNRGIKTRFFWATPRSCSESIEVYRLKK